MNDVKYKLYGRPNTGSDIVQMLLEEIGSPYELIQVSRDAADVEAYRRIALTLTPFALGSDISAVDFYLYVVGGWLPEGWAPVHAKWPALAQHTALLAERPSVRKVEAQRNEN